VLKKHLDLETFEKISKPDFKLGLLKIKKPVH
jgi:hypothetical protein